MSTTNKSLLISYRRRQVISQNRWNKSGKWQPHLQPQTSSDKHRLIEINEAYKITRKAKPTIYTLARKGLVPAYKRGKKLYFYEGKLLQWIESGRKQQRQYMKQSANQREVIIFDLHSYGTSQLTTEGITTRPCVSEPRCPAASSRQIFFLLGG